MRMAKITLCAGVLPYAAGGILGKMDVVKPTRRKNARWPYQYLWVIALKWLRCLELVGFEQAF